MATWDLGDFTSYELGKVAGVFRDRIAETKHASASHVLRAACVDHLIVDQRYGTPWADPSFQPRYAWLRAELERAAGDKPLHLVEALAVVEALDLLVAELEARDA